MLNGILAYIGIGSNLGDSIRSCNEAVERLSGVAGVSVQRISSLYKTEPLSDHPGAAEREKELACQNWFINAAAEIKTVLAPGELWQAMREIEKNMGRVRTFPGAPRVIDLDLLLYGQEIISEKDLIVPHPRMHKRLFALAPLCEIASYVIHPAFGVSLRGLKDRLENQKIVLRCENEALKVAVKC